MTPHPARPERARRLNAPAGGAGASATPSARFRAWVETQLRAAAPGWMFPTDARCAALFGISPATVKRILVPYRNRGLLCRVAGKGTFLPLPQGTPCVPASPLRSAETIVALLRDQVRNGMLRRGELLPPLKQFTLRWRTSRATLLRALRILAGEGMLAKIGRHWHAGAAGDAMPLKQTRHVAAFHPDSVPFRNLYTDHPFALAYRVLEHELLRAGATLSYHAMSELDALAREWRRAGRVPHGLFLAYLSDADHETLRPVLRGLLAVSQPGRPEILVAGAVVRDRLGGVTYCNFGHANTERFRLLAHWLVERGYRDIHLWNARGPRAPRGDFLRLAKVWVELRHLCGEAQVTLHVPAPAARERHARLRALFAAVPREQMTHVLGKYGRDTDATIENDIVFFAGSPDLAALVRPDQAWIAETDADALRVRNAVLSRRRRPRNVSVLSLENDPAFLPHGISACVVDQYTMGYQMAQALRDHTRVGRSRAGYLKTPGLILERATTPIGPAADLFDLLQNR